MMIRLPVERELWSRVRLAQVFIHEFYHLLGYKHWDYRNYRGDLTKSWNVDWVKEYPIKEKVAPAKQDLQLFRYEHSKKMFERKERALKRLQTSLRKWKQKVRRYETVMAKRANSWATKPPPSGAFWLLQSRNPSLLRKTPLNLSPFTLSPIREKVNKITFR